jgi:hypothetical protein
MVTETAFQEIMNYLEKKEAPEEVINLFMRYVWAISVGPQEEKTIVEKMRELSEFIVFIEAVQTINEKEV